MKQLLSTLGAFVIGAGTMYYLDPEMGRRRRAMVRDRIVGTSHDMRDYMASTSRRASDHAYGLFANARRAMRREQLNDEQLNGRVRARLGRLVSHPHAVETEVHNGRVVLRGPILAHEQAALMAGIWAMKGVRGIDNQLTLHDHPGDIPALQGEPRRPRGMRMRRWSGALPALAVAGGVGAGLRALTEHDGNNRTLSSSLAMALLAYGIGDGTRRAVRRRRGQAPEATASRHGETAMEHAPTLGRQAPTTPAPSPTWQH